MAIQSFKCSKTEELFATGRSRHYAPIKAVAERKLQMLDSAASLDF